MNKNVTVAFFGCKNITKTCIEVFNERIDKIDHLISISKELGVKNKVSGYMDLKDYAYKNKINHVLVNKYSLNNKSDINTINNYNIDVAFVIGWQRLIPNAILKNIKIGVFGMHGSADNLPKGRGRSPMNWSLILNKKHFYTNLFKYENNIDGGGILDTHCFDILKNDTIETLHFKNMLSMILLIEKNYEKIITNNFNLKKQKESKSTYFPKRVASDGAIEWNIKSKNIINLSRSLTRPFPGSYSYINSEKIIIWKMEEFSNTFKSIKADPGEIIQVFYNYKFLVKSYDSIIIVHDYEIDNPSLIKAGNKFDVIDLQKIYRDIEKRYPEFVLDKQKEISLDQMLKDKLIT